MCEDDMELYEKSAEGSFANPTVDESIVLAVVSYFEKHGKSYPYEVIEVVSEKENVLQENVRLALRKLHMGKRVVNAPPFTGQFELVE